MTTQENEVVECLAPICGYPPYTYVEVEEEEEEGEGMEDGLFLSPCMGHEISPGAPNER